MTIKEARKLLDKEAEKMSDDEVAECIETGKFFADILIDKILSMSEEERKNLLKKYK